MRPNTRPGFESRTGLKTFGVEKWQGEPLGGNTGRGVVNGRKSSKTDDLYQFNIRLESYWSLKYDCAGTGSWSTTMVDSAPQNHDNIRHRGGRLD